MVGFTRSGVPSLFPSNLPCEGCSALPKYHNQAKLTGLVTKSGVAQVQWRPLNSAPAAALATATSSERKGEAWTFLIGADYESVPNRVPQCHSMAPAALATLFYLPCLSALATTRRT